MSEGHKFNSAHAARLNDPERLKTLPPEVLWRRLGPSEPRVIVDLGPGAGLITSAFARLAPESTIYAADISAEMLGYLAEHLDGDLVHRVVPILASETRVPLADGLADAVTMVALYHELADPAGTLSDAFRMLAPGGRLLIVDWVKERTESGPPYEHRVSGEQIRAAVTDAGFTHVECVLEPPGFTTVTASRP